MMNTIPVTSSQLLAGRFEKRAELGSGGMGSVWLAQDLRLNRLVALKELVPGRGGEDLATARQRAVIEAQALARVRHPVIVPIHDLFFERGNPWIVMEYIGCLT